MDLSKELKLLKYSSDLKLFLTEILGLTCKKFHKEWLDLFENNDYVALLAPRGSGKTSIIAGYLLWKISTNPDIRILLVTINQDKAIEIMSYIQKHLEDNDKLIKLFGQQKGLSDWSRSTVRVYGAKGKHKEPTLQVLGVTASMVGGHYDIIILDDITDQKNSRTEHRRRELVRWLNSTLMPMLEPHGKLVCVGTKWHQSDIHSYFQGLSNYKSKIYKAIIEEPTDNKKAKVLWPERFSYEKLNEIRKTYGNVSFMMQYQNEYISDAEAPIKYDWVQNAVDGYTIVSPPYEVYMGVDMSSKGEESDYFSISIVAEKEGFFYLLDGYRDHISMHNQFKKIREYDYKWKPSKIGIESSGPQKMIVEQIIEENPAMPIVPVKSSSMNDKMTRVQRLSVIFETGRIFLNPRLVDWVDELISFPRGSHDDCVDSLAFAIQSSQEINDEYIVDWDKVASSISTRRSRSTGPSQRMYRMYKV